MIGSPSIVALPAHPSRFLKAALEAFYACVRTAKLPLTVEDVVRVKAGPFKGKLGVPITIKSIEPEPKYLIELEPPVGDAVLPLSVLERITPEELIPPA